MGAGCSAARHPPRCLAQAACPSERTALPSAPDGKGGTRQGDCIGAERGVQQHHHLLNIPPLLLCTARRGGAGLNRQGGWGLCRFAAAVQGAGQTAIQQAAPREPIRTKNVHSWMLDGWLVAPACTAARGAGRAADSCVVHAEGWPTLLASLQPAASPRAGPGRAGFPQRGEGVPAAALIAAPAPAQGGGAGQSAMQGQPCHCRTQPTRLLNLAPPPLVHGWRGRLRLLLQVGSRRRLGQLEGAPVGRSQAGLASAWHGCSRRLHSSPRMQTGSRLPSVPAHGAVAAPLLQRRVRILRLAHRKRAVPQAEAAAGRGGSGGWKSRRRSMRGGRAGL